jgi:hypothetical protein
VVRGFPYFLYIWEPIIRAFQKKNMQDVRQIILLEYYHALFNLACQQVMKSRGEIVEDENGIGRKGEERETSMPLAFEIDLRNRPSQSTYA